MAHGSLMSYADFMGFKENVLIVLFSICVLAAASPAMALGPETAAFYSNRATEREKIGELHKAISDWKSAIALGEKTPKNYLDCGIARMRVGEYSEAIEDLNRAGELDPNDEHIQHVRASAYHRRALVRSGKSYYQGALKDAEQAIKIWQGYVGAFITRSAIKRYQGDTKGAIDDLTEAIRLDLNHDYLYAYGLRGSLKKSSNDLVGAVTDLTAYKSLSRKTSKDNPLGNLKNFVDALVDTLRL